jgi:hypothetical protein
MREGDVVRVVWSDVDVAVLEIVDGRCPSIHGGDEVCVWEGEVRTTIEFRAGDGSERRVLTGISAGSGRTEYGDRSWTAFDLAEVSVQSPDAAGNLTLYGSRSSRRIQPPSTQRAWIARPSPTAS